MIARRVPLSFGVLSVVTLLVGACDDSGPVGPLNPRSLTPSLEIAAADEPPDSGAITVYPYDGPRPDAEDLAVRTLAVQAASPSIRIGVVPSAISVTLGSTADYTISDKATGLVLLTGNDGSATVTLVSAPPPFWRLQVVCGNAASVAARKAAAEAAGYETFTEFVASASCTRLYLGKFPGPPANTFAARTAFRNEAMARGFAGNDSFYRLVATGPVVYRLSRGSAVSESVNPIVVTSTTGLVLIGGRPYRGKGEARVNGSGSLAGINELAIEEYLYGVVPRELGPVAFAEFEAQKAQAVAARTFAEAGRGRRGSDGYDLRATTDDQVYGGYAAEHPVSTAAVDATAGLVATFNGALISANYHSTSGGHTADNEESFNGAPVSYLRGVPDAQRGRALDHVPSLAVFKAHANPTSLRAAKEGDFESDWARLHRWTFAWTMDEMTEVISDFAQEPVGKVTAIEVLSRGPSGRVIDIKYVTEAGDFVSSKGGIRSSLKFIDASGTLANLPSTLLFIEPLTDPKTKELVGYRVYGGGFGHGVGLSQTGAVGMAQKGHSHEEILKHYYRGIELTAAY
jgi:stage II sporulation protein D